MLVLLRIFKLISKVICKIINFILHKFYDDFYVFSWVIHMDGVPGTLYEGEKFLLQFKFTNKYPFDSPEVSVVFLSKKNHLNFI